MSEEKLYVVKNDEGEYLDQDQVFGSGAWAWAKQNKNVAELIARNCSGHVVTLVEEPKKAVLTKEQAETVKSAHGSKWPALLIDNYANGSKHEEELLMNAYVNGYTVEKDKKYNVKVPKKWSGDDKHYWTKEQDGSLTWSYLINKDYMIPAQQFTEAEVDHYGLQDCEKVEVTDDEQ